MEHLVANQEAAGSSPAYRSKFFRRKFKIFSTQVLLNAVDNTSISGVITRQNMKKLFLYFLIAVALLTDNTKNVLIRYSIYSLITIISILGLFTIIERRQIKTQIKTQIRISQISTEIQDTQKVIEANQARELAIKKVSKIISRYNHSLDESSIRAYSNEVFQMTLKYDNLDINLICATINHESA